MPVNKIRTADNSKLQAINPDNFDLNPSVQHGEAERLAFSRTVKAHDGDKQVKQNKALKIFENTTKDVSIRNYSQINTYLKEHSPSFQTCSNAAVVCSYLENKLPISDEEMHAISTNNLRSEARMRKQLRNHFKVSRVLFDSEKVLKKTSFQSKVTVV